MVTIPSAEISRRQFLAAGGLAVAAAWLAPTALFAQSDDVLVPGAFKEAATAKITVQTLRRNISVLLGRAETSLFLPAPTGSCSWMQKSSPRVRMFPPLWRASMRTPSSN